VSNGVHTQWGKLGSKGSSKLISDGPPDSRVRELERRACAKIRRGYTIHAPDTYLPQ
jgi:predicted DNA-binding WGR domain protein